jgi:hypothetical protein
VGERKVFLRASSSEGHAPAGMTYDARTAAEYAARVDAAFRPESAPPRDACLTCGDTCGLREFQETADD